MRCGLRKLSEMERGSVAREIGSELMVARDALPAGVGHRRKVSGKL
jgi:hypothetical protein